MKSKTKGHIEHVSFFCTTGATVRPRTWVGTFSLPSTRKDGERTRVYQTHLHSVREPRPWWFVLRVLEGSVSDRGHCATGSIMLWRTPGRVEVCWKGAHRHHLSRILKPNLSGPKFKTETVKEGHPQTSEVIPWHYSVRNRILRDSSMVDTSEPFDKFERDGVEGRDILPLNLRTKCLTKFSIFIHIVLISSSVNHAQSIKTMIFCCDYG